MKCEYDEEADVMMIELSRDSPDYGEEADGVIYHYSKEGKPVEIEILDASVTVAKLASLLKGVKLKS
ncbi:hypothetical protein CMI48_02490 [Candidatus Pacearchaeota archaeon]|jgi:uncharacterized protein YuzE|nr:hypothetical protein [Candidatus Pacearchaeota archaeon]|tara:strand:+ start:257 stop:457 length:201 start_codon:yes stop_codon:yes gene_type:complete